MAWRPYENLIAGELDNRTRGKVTGWMRFFRRGRNPLDVELNLTGDFHRDIQGKVIKLQNASPADKNELLERPGSYMTGFASIQTGQAGDITAGLPLTDDAKSCPYVPYPYIEWYGPNGRIVLELDPSQVEIVGEGRVSELRPEGLPESERESDMITSFARTIEKAFEQEGDSEGFSVKPFSLQ